MSAYHDIVRSPLGPVRSPSFGYRYGLSVLAIIVATILRGSLPALFGGTIYLAFYPAVVGAAAFGGLGPALLATIGGAMIEDFLFAPPQGVLTLLHDPLQLLRTVVFILSGLIVGLISEKQRLGRYREQLQTEKLSELVQLTDMATIFIRNAESRIIHWSKGCEHLYGFTPAEAIGMISYKLLKTEFPEPLQQIEALVQTEGRWEGELVQTRRDGRKISLTSLWILHRDSRSRPAAILEVNSDITTLKRTEEELQGLNRTLEERVVERTKLAELRAKQLQALAVQLSETEDRERRRLSEILHDDLQQLIVGAQMHLSVVAHQPSLQPCVTQAVSRASELLDASLARARDLTCQLSPPVLSQRGLIAALDWLARHMQEQYGLQVKVKANQDADPKDPTRKVFLFKAAQELLLNVIKHAGTHEALVTACRQNGQIVMEVRDEGCGFDPHEFAKPSSRGFGLFSLQQRIEQISGTLTVKSNVGEGTHVILAIPDEGPPVQAIPDKNLAYSDSDIRSTPCSSAQAERDAGGRLRLLLVDDHDIMRESLATLLIEEGDLDIVGHASNGREAVDLAIRLQPDVILMDVTMPILDGIEATRQIKSTLHNVRVIGLSMHDSKDMADAMCSAGAEQYLSKHASPQQLLKAIRKTDHAVALEH